MAMKQLADDQLAAFDTEYVTEPLWDILKRRIDRAFPDGRFSFIDIGGGNGVFADRLLAAYPDATGTVLAYIVGITLRRARGSARPAPSPP